MFFLPFISSLKHVEWILNEFFSSLKVFFFFCYETFPPSEDCERKISFWYDWKWILWIWREDFREIMNWFSFSEMERALGGFRLRNFKTLKVKRNFIARIKTKNMVGNKILFCCDLVFICHTYPLDIPTDFFINKHLLCLRFILSFVSN